MWRFRNIASPQGSWGWQSRGVSAIALTAILSLVIGQVALSQGGSKEKSANVRVDAKGRKFVNKIPYDVFFDDPLDLVRSNSSPVAPKSDAGASDPAPKTGSPPSAPANSGTPAAITASGSLEWGKLIPIEELQGEVKAVRNSLTKSMSNQGSYNSNFQEIAIDGSELAALAGIMQSHPESVTWKDKAHFVREFAGQLSTSAAGLGKENFEKTRSAFQRLTSVLDGSIPPDAGEVPSAREFSEVASRKRLMKRIERAKNFLKQDVNSEAKFKSLSDQIRREASLLTALGTVITTTGYDYTGEDEYQQHARTLIDGGREAFSASQEEAYDRFQEAVDKVNKSCTDCHASYGNG
ncbi:hypothetical protein [Schlesneria sp. T3-172]|uniref:hypothetical protein n=1 Tax=Schlesneria sphaerica TaxID=3373610 RepID=UPI0037C9D841